MTRRRLPLTLAVVGVLVIVAAIIAATVVRSNDTATLALGERPDVPVIVSEPGVLDAVHPEVTVRATAEDGEPVVLAVGRSSEVDAWLGGVEHARVTGLSSWEELTVEVVPASEAPAPTDGETAPDEAADPAALPDPAGSDLWVAEADGTGTAELSWTDTPGRWSLVAATDGSGPAPEVELEWGREVSTAWLVPAIILGTIILAAGVTMIVLDVLAKREQRRRDEAAARGDEGPRSSITDTDPGTGERLTRRQIREMERAMAQEDRNRRAGAVAPVPAAPGEIDLPDPDDPQSPAADLPTAAVPHGRGVGEPGADEPAHEPGVGERGAREPGADEPGAHEPGAGEPGVRERGDREPGVDESGVDERGARQPGVGEPGVGERGARQPGVGEPGAGEPGAGERGVGERGAHGRDVDEPDAAATGTSTGTATGAAGVAGADGRDAVDTDSDDTLAPPAHPAEGDDARESDDPDEDDELIAPSWRSVWGFGGAPAPRAAQNPSDRPQSDDGEERR